jgi:hypothetical protein
MAGAYVLRKTTGYWFYQGDPKYTLSSDPRAWWAYPQPRRLPPRILRADEKAAIDKARQERRRMIHTLDRAAALEKWGPLPESKGEKPESKAAPAKEGTAPAATTAPLPKSEAVPSLR